MGTMTTEHAAEMRQLTRKIREDAEARAARAATCCPLCPERVARYNAEALASADEIDAALTAHGF